MGLLPPQLVAPAKLAEAQACIQAGGDGVRDGVAVTLTAIVEYADSGGTDGVNSSQVLMAAMRRLTEDPYLTLGVEPESEEGVIKKAYRKLALRYHPDKNKATSTLFQAVQGAHDILIEPDKRAEYDIKRKRQQEALTRLRKHAKGPGPPAAAGAATGATNTRGSTPTGGTRSKSPPHGGAGGGRAGAPAAGAGGGSSKKSSPAGGKSPTRETSARGESASASGDEKVHQFNKRFYEEFRREAQKHDKSKGSKGTAAAASGTSAHQPPSRPKMRSTNRTDTTVTLEWHCGGLPSTTAYELQWRQRGRTASDWVTSPTLIVGSSCRKKNMEPCTCYEFRVRAASAWGWSPYCDPVMVVTLPSATYASGEGGGTNGDNTFATPRQKVSGFQSDGIGGSAGAADQARAQVKEARQRRSQTQRADQQSCNDGAAGPDEDTTSRKKPSSSQASHRFSKGGADFRRGTGVDAGGGGSGPAGAAMEKTNSWYWRRMSRAAAQDERDGNADGAAKEKSQRRRTMQEQGTPSQGAWACIVCKRQNEPASKSCWVCYTPRSYQPVNLDRIRTEKETPGGRGSESSVNLSSKVSMGSPSGSTTAPRESPTPSTQTKKSPTSRQSVGGNGKATEGNQAEQGNSMSDKVPSIRVYSVPSSTEPSSGGGTDGDGIRVRAATAGAGDGNVDPAGVWEFTEGDLDNIGNGPTTYGSDDDWSYASDAGGLDTRSDPGETARYRQRSSTTPGAKSAKKRRESSRTGTTGVGGDKSGAASPKRYLNGRITKLHNVRAEPIKDANVVGYLLATKEVEVIAEVGDWYKVRWHKRAKNQPQPDSAPSACEGEERGTDPSPDSTNPSADGSADVSGKPKDGGGVEKASDTGEASEVEETVEEDGAKTGYGWCLTRDSKHEYLVTIGAEEASLDANRRPSSATNSRRRSTAGRRRSSIPINQYDAAVERGQDALFDEEGEGECWHELKDEDGSVYYFNTSSGVSQWEPPLWLDEIDPTTGAAYYVNSYSGEPQWERPADFIPILRENPYATTPEQEFIKSVLSPKRSKGPKSFHEAMHGATKAAHAPSAQHLNTVSEGKAATSAGAEVEGKSRDAAAA